MISMDKEYRTRDGKEAKVVAVDLKNTGYPVIAIVDREIQDYTSDGFYFKHKSPNPNDLIEVKPRIKRELWVNIYEGAVGGLQVDRESADIAGSSDRIACVKVTIDCEHGEGL